MPKKNTAAKKTDTTTREPAAKDKFGCREGSQSAAINAALTAKAQDVATLAEKSGCTQARVRNHLRDLLAKDLIVQGDDGHAHHRFRVYQRQRIGPARRL